MTTTPKPHSRRSGITMRSAPIAGGSPLPLYLLDPLTVPGVNTADGRGVVAQDLLLAPLKLQIPSWQPEPSEPTDKEHTCEIWWDSADGPRLLDTFYVGVPPQSNDHH